MVQLDDEQYQKLVKDADDNRQMVRIARYILITILAIILYFTYISPLLQIHVSMVRERAEQSLALSEANNNVRIMQIESEGLTTEEYFTWLKLRSELEN